MTKGQEREGKLDSQITLRMPLEVHDRARVAAAYKRTSVNQVIVEVLDEHLPELPRGYPVTVTLKRARASV
jgi:predicted HicB family RNase H-like nuclease